jgi:hypothetical protein
MVAPLSKMGTIQDLAKIPKGSWVKVFAVEEALDSLRES